MMFREVHGNIALTELSELIPKHAAHENLFLDPGEHGRDKTDVTARSKGVIGLQKPFKLEKRFFVKSYSGKILEVQAGLLQDISASIDGK